LQSRVKPNGKNPPAYSSADFREFLSTVPEEALQARFAQAENPQAEIDRFRAGRFTEEEAMEIDGGIQQWKAGNAAKWFSSWGWRTKDAPKI
jgi:hypothetical protein